MHGYVLVYYFVILTCYVYDSSVDIHRTRLFLNFQSMLILHLLWVMYDLYWIIYCCIGHDCGIYNMWPSLSTIQSLFFQTNEFARNILHIFYLCKNLNCFEGKLGDWCDCGSQSGALKVVAAERSFYYKYRMLSVTCAMSHEMLQPTHAITLLYIIDLIQASLLRMVVVFTWCITLSK